MEAVKLEMKPSLKELILSVSPGSCPSLWTSLEVLPLKRVEKKPKNQAGDRWCCTNSKEVPGLAE